LRDLHTGAFGVTGVALLLLAKYAALASLAVLVEPAGWLPLILIPTTARWGMTATIVLHPYARSEPGLGARAKTGAGAVQLATATTITLAVTAAVWWAGLHWGAVVIVVVIATTMFLAAQWIRSRIGGLTGDAYGALCELGEAAGLLAASALAFRGLVS
jgi:adenosylcobinamide-GDP ribazoletransferase